MPSAQTRPFGVYIHWPFCAQKCPYCDFNSHVRFSGWDEARFLSAYLRELDWVAQRRGAVTSPVSSIFFGGGTPSLMKPETVGAILDHIGKLWCIERDAEVTIEANPGSVDAYRFAGYRAAGANRVSIGLQSLRDDELKRLGRIHTVAEAKAALAIARKTFERTSFDLIYARPQQKPQDWREELSDALALCDDHVSLYQLTIEPDTPYAALHAAGKLVVPDPDAAHALYEITQELTGGKGLTAYEISNHAKPGAESRHNLLYWRYGEYAGVGPGAHGRLVMPPADDETAARDAPRRSVRVATVAEKHPETWAERVLRTGHGYVECTALTRSEAADELLLMGLRLVEGVDVSRLAALGGVRPAQSAFDELVSLGLIEGCGGDVAELRHASRNELDEIRMCLQPGIGPDPTSGLAAGARAGSGAARGLSGLPSRLRTTARGRFVLNAVVARLSQSFEDVAAMPDMDSEEAGH